MMMQESVESPHEPQTPPAKFLQPDDQLMGGLPSSLKLHTLRSFSEPNLASKLLPRSADKAPQNGRHGPGELTWHLKNLSTCLA